LHQGGRDVDLQLWTLLSFELWCRRFLDGAIRTDRAPAERRDPARPPVVAHREASRTAASL
jgi:hypothetical protein